PEDYRSASSIEDMVRGLGDTMKEYFLRMTDRKTFQTRDIIVWENGEYRPKYPISQKSFNEICSHLNADEKGQLTVFLQSNWGVLYE
ncbi:MAG: pilus assembly protein CpaF, partial [Clostridia bacterium]|nr:pilus assembly protein CpaF [Clostridia bacterium]